MYEIWSAYGFECEQEIGAHDCLGRAQRIAQDEADAGSPDVRVWRRLESGGMVQEFAAIENMLNEPEW